MPFPPHPSIDKNKKKLQRPLDEDELGTSDPPSDEVTSSEGVRKGIGEKKKN